MSALLSRDTFYVTRLGTARLGAFPLTGNEATFAVCAQILKSATPPEGTGDAIPVAPGRGPVISFMPYRTVMTENGPRSMRDGHKGAKAVQVTDVFDHMIDQAMRSHCRLVKNAKSKKAKVPAYVPPFTVGQVAVAREYATLTERCHASGLKCSSLEALRNASNSGGDREEAMLADFQRLRAMHRRVGDGLAKEVRRIRPGGDKRSAIRARDLVDRVCLGGQTIAEVLAACGWSVDQKSTEALRKALCSALDRMRGYDLNKPQDAA